MKGDFSKLTFDPTKHYSRVLQQQGRVSLDSDINEASAIHNYRARKSLRDLIGTRGGPLDQDGFRISVDDVSNLGVSAGIYYVNGILCENDEPLTLNPEEILFNGSTLENENSYLAFLDVWERHITSIEDPEIREVALGGPDTTTRTRVEWQVRLLRLEQSSPLCSDFGPDWEPQESNGRLQARTQPGVGNPPVGGGFHGLENNLYRVEIFDPVTTDAATFIWSRSNGSEVVEWLSQNGDILQVANNGGSESRFAAGDWVEINDVNRELKGLRGALVQLADVTGNAFTINPNPNALNLPQDLGPDLDFDAFDSTRKIRRWDSDGAQPLFDPAAIDAYIPLENGVEIRFDPDGMYQTGDYWLIPARTNLGDVIWPTESVDGNDEPVAQPKHGVDHYYAPLALLRRDGNGSWEDVRNCRSFFPQIAELLTGSSEGLCTFTLDEAANLQGMVNTLATMGGGRSYLHPRR